MMLRILVNKESLKHFWITIRKMKEEKCYIDEETYLSILGVLKKAKMATDVAALNHFYDRMIKENAMDGVARNVVKVILGGEWGKKVEKELEEMKIEDAVKLFELMMDCPYKPSVQDCNLLLKSISSSDSPNLDLVFRVAKKYESMGNFLSKAMYDGIHRSLRSVGKFDEAEKIMKAMKNAGYEPDNITYSQLVFGLCKARRSDEASELLDEMEANGCVPDIKTWTILIQGQSAANEVDKALMCFAKLMETNCDADADLLDVLVKGFLRQNRVTGAYELLMGLVEKACLRPWQATYKTLIEMLLGFGSLQDALDFLKVLSVKEYPSSSAYLHVFQSFFNEGRHSEAKDLLYKCPHHIRMILKSLHFLVLRSEAKLLCLLGRNQLKCKIFW
ncbi:hypothetical protein EZV62_013110 [Acer yangbiense]|uniref:Pentacotripeptide-repeat region of PRORP domain-containing protein n=1 Tax=Acer yangbiense TaxID=1000413 RepID=A0A5C7HXA5_9ROSI|nr:hypothetical protein EZV62_013110 [Acer yangbiense]